jgi:hypothetical protein
MFILLIRITYLIACIVIACFLVIFVFRFILYRKIRITSTKASIKSNITQKLSQIKRIDKLVQSTNSTDAAPSKDSIDIIAKFINELFANYKVYIHVTKDKINADNIINEGFKYAENFFKTTEEVSSNIIILTYKLQLVKNYGKYVVIICIPKEIFQSATTNELKLNSDLLAECGISEFTPNEELHFTLPSRYVRGYIDINSNQIFDNKLFEFERSDS